LDWDVQLYQKNHSFVPEYGKALLAYLPEDGNTAILDLGCGDGVLTSELAKKYRRVVGVDRSEPMISAARARNPGIDFRVMDALDMPFDNEYDVVFSNAVFHWIPDQPRLLAQIYKALKREGFLVCEFGAYGNVGRIMAAVATVLASIGSAMSTRFFYPKAEDYAQMLKNEGFAAQVLYEFDRPTPLPGGTDGLHGWMMQFLEADIGRLQASVREAVISQTEEALRGSLWDGQRWTADYRRIRVVATKALNM
jgi:trans-aconitate methyltransferase